VLDLDAHRAKASAAATSPPEANRATAARSSPPRLARTEPLCGPEDAANEAESGAAARLALVLAEAAAGLAALVDGAAEEVDEGAECAGPHVEAGGEPGLPEAPGRAASPLPGSRSKGELQLLLRAPPAPTDAAALSFSRGYSFLGRCGRT
jgi:hypothetical protein